MSTAEEGYAKAMPRLGDQGHRRQEECFSLVTCEPHPQTPSASSSGGRTPSLMSAALSLSALSLLGQPAQCKDQQGGRRQWNKPGCPMLSLTFGTMVSSSSYNSKIVTLQLRDLRLNFNSQWLTLTSPVTTALDLSSQPLTPTEGHKPSAGASSVEELWLGLTNTYLPFWSQQSLQTL